MSLTLDQALLQPKEQLQIPDDVRTILRGQIPWRGAVPDMDKLAASTQMDTHGLWWGWDVPAELAKTYPPEEFANWRARTKCDICIYEAFIFYLEVYYCPLHWKLMV